MLIRCPVRDCPSPLQPRPADADVSSAWFPGDGLDDRLRAGVASHLEIVHALTPDVAAAMAIRDLSLFPDPTPAGEPIP